METQNQTRSQEEAKGQREGNHISLYPPRGTARAQNRQRAGETASHLCSLRISGFYILLFFFFPSFLKFMIYLLLILNEKRHSESHCFTFDSISLPKSESHFRRRMGGTWWFMISSLCNAGFPSESIICSLLLQSITFKEMFSYSIPRALILGKWSWLKVTVRGNVNSFLLASPQGGPEFYSEWWS